MPFKNRQQAGFGPWVIDFTDPYLKQQEIYLLFPRPRNNTEV